MTSSSIVKLAQGSVTMPKGVSRVSRDRVNSVEAILTALTQKLVPDIEANSVLFQLCSRGDMLSSGATRNSGMEVTQSVTTLMTCGEHQVG